MDGDGLGNERQRPMANINDLPEEILVKIMSNLTLFHRKRMRLVCKYWNDISYDRSLIKDDWMVVPSVADMKKLEERHPAHRFTNLRIRSVNHDLEESDVWETFGPFIQKIELHGIVNTRNSVFADIYVHCRELTPINFSREISLTDSFSIVYSVCSTATVNLVTRDAFLSDFGFNVWAPEPMCMTKFVLRNNSNLSLTQNELFTIMLARQSNVLTHVEISGFSYGTANETLIDLLSCVGPQLISLDISNNVMLSDDCLGKICDSFPNLDVINLSKCSFNTTYIHSFKTEAVKDIFIYLQKLSVVAISNTSITDDVLLAISYLNNLRIIDLSLCRRITSYGLISAFTMRFMPKLEVLNLRSLSAVSDEVIAAIAPMVPNLTCWDLSYTSISSIQPIINHNKRLRVLSLNGCELSTYEITAISDLKELRELKIDFSIGLGVSDSLMRYLSLKQLRKISFEFRRPKSISDNLTKYLKFSHLSEPEILAFIDACPSLELIDMSRLLLPRPHPIFVESSLSKHAIDLFKLC